MKKKVLVTGADGFIGSHVVEHLVAQGHEVRAFVYYNSFNSSGWLDRVPAEQLAGVEIFPGDVRDADRVRQAAAGCDWIFHLAALIAIPYSYVAPESYVDTNVKGTLNVLRAAREAQATRVLLASTSEVYGTAEYVPMDEKHPLKGQSPYAATKIAADQLGYSFFCSFATPVTIVRPFNTFGPRQSLRAIIPTIIAQAVEGKTIKLGYLDSTRDFSFVKDTASGFEAVALAPKTVGEVVNLGNGFELSIQGVVDLVGEVLGKKLEVVAENQRLRPEKSEVLRLYSDPTKVKALTGWKPRFTGKEGFKTALRETIEWYGRDENRAANAKQRDLYVL